MRIVIVGAGEVGIHIAQKLIDEGKDVVLIDKDPLVVKRASAKLDCIVVKGEGTRFEILREARIEGAEVFIAATQSDEVNMIACFIVSSEFKVPLKIARVRSAEYSRNRTLHSKLAGVDYIVNTDSEAAWELFQTLEQGAGGTITMLNSKVQIRGFYVDIDSYFLGRNLKNIHDDIKAPFVIAAIIRDGELLTLSPELEVEAEDNVFMVALSGTFHKISQKVGSHTDKIRKIAIVGGTTIGMMVADLLSSKGRSVVLIDKDYEVCANVASEMPEIMVVNGDASDSTLYADEEINKMDAIVTTTLNEELNIISGVYAKATGVKRALAVVEKTSYLNVAAGIGIDSTVSTKYCAINSILKFIRKGNVRSVHSIFDGKAEAVDVSMKSDSKLINKPLKELELPDGCMVIAVERKRKSMIPDEDFKLLAGDNVIIFAKKNVIHELEQLLES